MKNVLPIAALWGATLVACSTTTQLPAPPPAPQPSIAQAQPAESPKPPAAQAPRPQPAEASKHSEPAPKAAAPESAPKKPAGKSAAPRAPAKPATSAPPKTEASAAPKPETVAKAPSAAPPAPAAKPAPLDLKSLEERLKDSNAIGVMTKLSLKNQVDDLVARFRAYHSGERPPTLPQLRPAFELLLMKVLSLLQDKDPALAHDVDASREAIWGVLSDRARFEQFI